MRRQALGLMLLGLVATGSAGCKDLHYFDIAVNFTGFSTGSGVSMIETCHVYVSGADSADFYIIKNCPPPNNSPSMGTFEYSSNADSGNMTFTMKVYNGIPEDDVCLFGQGMVSIPVGATTVNGTLNVAQTGNGCM